MTTAAMPMTVVLDGPPDPELLRIRDLVYQVAGIFHPDNKLRLLLDRCGRRMKELKTQSLREYFECLTIKPARQAELVALLNEITIGETCFFRSQAQLDALRNIILPKILEAKSKFPLRRLRIWSAGCSTGEEPYTLSILMLEEAQHRLKDWTIEILATDLNERSLAHAKNATYGAYSTRNLTPLLPAEIFHARRGSAPGAARGARRRLLQPSKSFRRRAHDFHEEYRRHLLLQCAHLL